MNIDINIEARRICSGCLNNKYFSALIRTNGSRGQCDFHESHGKRRNTLEIKNFCQYVDDYFRKNYCLGAEYRYSDDSSDKISYNNLGDTLEEILTTELACKEDDAESDIVSAVIETLIDSEYSDPSDFCNGFYNDTANYESLKIANQRHASELEDYWYEHRVSFQWYDFCKSVVFDTRFFNIKKQLDKLFGNIQEYSSEGRRPVYTISKGKTIFRARKLSSSLNKIAIKENPKKELGAPSADIAIAGRMNVQHIPAFYASFSAEVALRELQPYISEEVAIGEFTLERDIKVFDFTVFDRIYDDKYAAKDILRTLGTPYDVVTKMQNEISRPVSKDNKTKEYIPTQILTEYIQEHFKVDAIIYFSSLFSDKHTNDRRNIVLLNKKFENGRFENALSIDKSKVQIKSVTNIEYEVLDVPDWLF